MGVSEKHTDRQTYTYSSLIAMEPNIDIIIIINHMHEMVQITFTIPFANIQQKGACKSAALWLIQLHPSLQKSKVGIISPFEVSSGVVTSSKSPKRLKYHSEGPVTFTCYSYFLMLIFPSIYNPQMYACSIVLSPLKPFAM